MQLFALGWGLDGQAAGRLNRELLRTARGFPHLDLSTAWHHSFDHGVAAVGIASSPEMVAPRQYLYDDGADLVLYDGLPVAPGGSIVAHRASELAVHWDRLETELEGRFICVRIRRTSSEIEVLTDALGVGQLYFWEMDGASLVSNSAGLIQRAVDATQLDPLGVSLFLASDAVGADRTLRRGVRVARGGQRWSWRPGDARWTRQTYWSVARDIEDPTRTMDEGVADELIEGLASFAAGAARVTGRLNAPITGGKDSRMLAAVLMARGIDARYWTKGDAGSRDVAIAQQIVERYRFPHRFTNRPTQTDDGRDPTRDVAAEWPAITREFVLQTDGMASMFLVGNIQGQPSHVPRIEVTLSAMCAESARAVHAQAYLCTPDTSVRRIARYLPYAETHTPRGLVRAAAYATARDHVQGWVHDAAEAGVSVRNLPVAYYLDERCRRWATNNPRELAQTEDKVLPFLTRSYVGTVLSLDPDERAGHQVHRQVIRRLVPELEHEPPLDIPWPTGVHRTGRARSVYNVLMASLPHAARRGIIIGREFIHPTRVARAPWSPYDEASWLETNLSHARDTMLSTPSSPLWDYLHRGTAERLLAPGTSHDERRLHQLPLFAAYTMFLYEAIEAELRHAA